MFHSVFETSGVKVKYNKFSIDEFYKYNIKKLVLMNNTDIYKHTILLR